MFSLRIKVGPKLPAPVRTPSTCLGTAFSGNITFVEAAFPDLWRTRQSSFCHSFFVIEFLFDFPLYSSPTGFYEEFS